MDTTIESTNDLDLALLITALLAGPVAWAFTEGAGYAAVKPVCAGGAPIVLGAVAAVGLIITGAGAWLAWRRMSALRRTADAGGGRDVDRSYFIAALAVGLDLFIALLIITTVAMQLWSRCE